MMRDLSTLNHSRSVPVSPAMQWSSPGFGRMEHSAPPLGAFGRFETNYARGNYVGDGGSFETTPTGRRCIYKPIHILIHTLSQSLRNRSHVSISLRGININCLYDKNMNSLGTNLKTTDTC